MTDIPLKRRSPVSLRDCNLSKSFELIGDRWTLLILRSALYGLRRFDDFQADLDVPRSVLRTGSPVSSTAASWSAASTAKGANALASSTR